MVVAAQPPVTLQVMDNVNVVLPPAATVADEGLMETLAVPAAEARVWRPMAEPPTTATHEMRVTRPRTDRQKDPGRAWCEWCRTPPSDGPLTQPLSLWCIDLPPCVEDHPAVAARHLSPTVAGTAGYAAPYGCCRFSVTMWRCTSTKRARLSSTRGAVACSYQHRGRKTREERVISRMIYRGVTLNA